MSRSLLGTAALTACLLVPTACGQVVRFIPVPGFYGDKFGQSVAGVPAFGDRPARVLVGAHMLREPNENSASGRIFMFDAHLGTLLHVRSSPNPSEGGQFGYGLAARLDGSADQVLVGAYYERLPGSNIRGLAYLMDAGEADLLYTFAPQYGSTLLSSFALFGIDFVPDIDADGEPDCVVPSYIELQTGRVHVFSSRTGERIRYIASPREDLTGEFGKVIAGSPDMDGDGLGEIIVGTPVEWVTKVNGAERGVLYVLSGATSEAIHRIYFHNIWSATAVPDVDGDGVPDFAGSRWTRGPGDERYGLVRMFSGATGAELWNAGDPHNPLSNMRFGWKVVGLPDVNHDGRGDLLVSAYVRGFVQGVQVGGHMDIFSGTDGRLLRTIPSPRGSEQIFFGWGASHLPDSNGDGAPEIIVGAPGENNGTTAVGAAYVFFSCPADWNADGFANSQDFFDYLGTFFTGSPQADVNADGFVNSQDFFDYLGRFFAGCG